MTSLKFSVANNAVTHLGRNLYSTTPPALAELVANSYDAYATDVKIELSNSSILIIDNGKGLDFQELEDKYAVIGSEKKEENPLKKLSFRKPMGKKGIGKLAAFSLGNKYTVYSKSVGSEKWLTFTLSYHDMIDTDVYSVDVSEVDLPNDLSHFNKYSSGFILKITEVRRKITTSTKNNIIKQLSRRFYINQHETDFHLSINDEQLVLDCNSYYEKMEYVLYFGIADKDKIKQQFSEAKKIECYDSDENLKEYFEKLQINGWMGTTSKPKDLKNEDGASFANVIVLANGKIADENILESKSNARIANNYLVGEIIADKFIADLEDPITSSRQGLDDSIPEVEEFIDKLDVIRKYVIEQWDDMRLANAVGNLPSRIKENKSYKEWMAGLSKSQKKINNNLLDLLSTRLDDDAKVNDHEVDSMVTSICTVINNIEADNLIVNFDTESDSTTQLNLLFKLMDNIAKTEDLNHANLIKKRLAAIENLEKLMSASNTPEKLFENHLSDNPWLIMPYWNIDRNRNSDAEYLKNQKYFLLDKGNNDFKRNFLDILIQVAEEKYPVLVELKKNTPIGHAKVTYSDIYNQVTNYRRAIIQKTPNLASIDEKDIKVIFILSEDTGLPGSGNSIEISIDEKRMLESMNISILKYNKILSEAKKMYQEHLNYQKEAKLLPDLNMYYN